jgi:hypothetical protein
MCIQWLSGVHIISFRKYKSRTTELESKQEEKEIKEAERCIR